MRKWIVIAALAVLLLVPVALLGVLLYTETGTSLIAAQLGRLERIGIRIEGLSGTLSGPLRVERFELDLPRVHIVSHDIVVEPQIRGLLLQTVQVSSLTARDTVVEIRRPPDLPVVERPPRFLPSFMRIDAEGVEFTRLRYVNINGLTIDAERLWGEVQITPRQLRVSKYQVDAEQFSANGSVRLRAQRPLALHLESRARLRMPRGEDAIVEGALDGTVEELEMRASVLRPSRALAEMKLTRPNDSWQIAGRVTSPQFSFEPWLERPPLSLRDVALEVLFDPEGIRAAGALGIPEYELHDLTVDARGRFEARVLHLASANLGLKDAPGTLHTSGTLSFDGGPPTLDLDAQWRELQWPLRGTAIVRSPSGEGTFQGSFPYQFDLHAEAVGPNIPAAKGAARGAVSKEALTLEEYGIDTLEGSIAGSGSLEFRQPRAWTLSARAHALNPAFLYQDFPGRLSFAVAGSGRGVDKNARFAVTMKDLTGSLRGERVGGSAAIERSAKGWRVSNGSARFGGARLELDGSWHDVVDARWSLNVESLDDLVPDSSGTLAFSGSVQGTRKTPHVVLDLRADNLRYDAWLARQLVIEGDVNLGADDPSRLFISAKRLGRNEPLIESLTVTSTGTTAAHQLDIDVVGTTAPGGEQPSRADIVAMGSFKDDVWNATLTTTRLSNGSQQLQIVEPANLIVSRERAALDNLCLAVGAGQLCANGKWERNGPWEGTVAGYEIPLATVLPQSSADAEYAGRIEGRVRAFGSPDQPWQAEAGMRIIDTAIIYRPPGAEPQTLQLGTGGLAANATAQEIKFSFGVQAFTDTFLFVSAQMERDGSNAIAHLPLKGDLRARAGDANILPLVFPEIDHAAGVLTANMNIAGTLAMPELDGRIELADGEFDSYRVNLALRDLSVVAEIADNQLAFTGSGSAGEGRLQSEGRFTWSDGTSQGRLHLKGENLLVADLPEYRVVASPDLHFLIDGNQLSVAGDVTVPQTRIQPANLTGVVRASDDARFVGEHPAELEGRLIVHSEIRVAMGEDVRVDALGLQGRITGSVGVTTRTGEQAIGRGELAVEEGRYEAYGQKLDIQRGRLLFEASPLDDPGLDIEARRQVETVEVGLNVRGTLREPRLTFFSDPSMPQTQIASYLLVGKPLEQAGSGDASSVNAARDALALQGGGLLASQLGRRFGLDEIGVESNTGSAGEATPALVLGKFLSPRLFVSYGISLTESINTLKLRYTISDRWILKTEAGENQSADVEFTIER